MLFLVGVLVVTVTTKGYLYGIFASILSVFIFNYYFTFPVHTLITYHTNDVILMVSFLGASLISGTMTKRFQKQLLIAKQNEHTARLLYRVTESFLNITGKRNIIITTVLMLVILFVGGCSIKNNIFGKNIVEAIEDRKPVITKDITIGGRVKGAENHGKVFKNVPIGMSIKHYIDECGGYIEPHGEIVLGGPFTGKHGEEESPITKTLGGILVAMPFPQDIRKVGIIACECGAEESRLREIAQAMGAEVVSETKCKRMTEVNGRYRCDMPGICPGQAEKCLKLKSEGAQVVIMGGCED